MLNAADKPAVARHFGRAAASYDLSAQVQAQVAAQLARRISALGLPAGARVLEIGCGTGLLTRQALASSPGIGHWLATDLSPAMVEQCALLRRGDARLQVAAMDGERPAVSGGFDLICSSLALQWFPDPAAALLGWRRLLRPGGRLLVASLAEGTFAEWSAALAAAGAGPVGLVYPSPALMQGWLPGLAVETRDLLEQHGDARHFLLALRGIGAGFATRRLDAATLRRAMRLLDRSRPVRITYRVALLQAAATCHP